MTLGRPNRSTQTAARLARIGGHNRRRQRSLRRRLPGGRTLLAAAGRRARAALPLAITLAIIGLVAGGGALGYRWLTRSARFAVAEVEVHGARHTPTAAIDHTLAAVRGANIFGLDLDRLEAELGRLPWIAHARVHRELPRRLVVDLDERTASVRVELGGIYLADASGRPFKRADEGDQADALPLVTGLDRAEVGRDPDAAAATVRAATAIAEVWATGKRPPLGEIHCDLQRGYTLYTLDPVRAIELGDGEPTALAHRMALYDSAWAALHDDERARATLFHLGRAGAPDRVTVAFAEMK